MSNELHVTQSRRYLLGDLPEPARTAFEEAYFSDPELMEDIWAAELALVDDYVARRLDSDEQRRFESHYLSTPQHRERVAVARALRAKVLADAQADETPTPATAAPEDAVQTRRADVVTGPFGAERKTQPRSERPASERTARPMRVAPWQWAAAAALTLAAAGLVWVLLGRGAVGPESSTATGPSTTPGATAPGTATPGALPGSTTPGATTPGSTPGATPPTTAPPTTTPPTGTPGPGPGTPPRSPVVLALTLSPIQLRSGESQARLAVPAGTDRLTLRFEGDPGSAREVSVEIKTVEGRRAWTGGVRVDATPKPGIIAAVTVPARSLPPDDYIATVFSIDANGERAELNRYVFRIAQP